MQNSNNNPFVTATNIGKIWGCKPHHYAKDDRTRLASILEYSGLDGDVNLSHESPLYSYHPPVHVKPVNVAERTRNADKFGFYRCDATQFLLRANMRNVSSCHRVEHDINCPGGNLNYLASASWACYLIYQDGAESTIKMEYSTDIPISELDGMQPMASVNCLFCWDDTGTPSVFMSRVYGDSGISGLMRLAEYFANTLGLRVYAQRSKIGLYKATSEYACIRVLGVPSPNLIRAHYADLIERYDDIQHARIHGSGTDARLLEAQTGYLLLTPSECTVVTPAFSPLHVSDTCEKRWTYCYTSHREILVSRQPAKPTDAKPLLSYVTGMHEDSHDATMQLGMEDGRARYTCADCGDRVDDDDMCSHNGTIYCESCYSDNFTIDINGESQCSEDCVYSDYHGEYILENDAVEYVASVGRYGRDTDYVYGRSLCRGDCDNIVWIETNCSVTDCEYAHCDLVTTITIMEADGATCEHTLLEADVHELCTLLDVDGYDADADDVYAWNDDADDVQAYIDSNRTPSLYAEIADAVDASTVHGRDADAYALLVWQPA